MQTTVAVGVDGSDSSLVALRWALETAGFRGAEVVAVVASSGKLREHLDLVHAAITRTAAGAPVRTEVLEGTATAVLLEMSDRVDLLVVGGHGYSGWKSVMSTSVAGKLAIHTRAALCVVREIPSPARGQIIVGYDGPSSESAVEFAAAEASRRGAVLTVVCSWHYAVRDTRADAPETAGLLAEGAAAALRSAVEVVSRNRPELRLNSVVKMGQPAEVLAELSASADLVVVGSHGRGELATLVVGSVARGVLQRVGIPVIIVPHRQ